MGQDSRGRTHAGNCDSMLVPCAVREHCSASFLFQFVREDVDVFAFVRTRIKKENEQRPRQSGIPDLLASLELTIGRALAVCLCAYHVCVCVHAANYCVEYHRVATAAHSCTFVLIALMTVHTSAVYTLAPPIHIFLLASTV